MRREADQDQKNCNEGGESSRKGSGNLIEEALICARADGRTLSSCLCLPSEEDRSTLPNATLPLEAPGFAIPTTTLVENMKRSRHGLSTMTNGHISLISEEITESYHLTTSAPKIEHPG